MNKQVIEFKKRFESGQLAQSFLITGPEKTGKFSTVIEMIGILNNLGEEELNLVKRGEIADVVLIETAECRQQRMMNEQPNSVVEDIKNKKVDGGKSVKKVRGDIITKKQIDSEMKGVSLKNFQLAKKIIIIKDADKMTNTAANSLLKIIEEPEKDVVIFLLVSNESNLLATIKSRCQLIRFAFLNDNNIRESIESDNISREDVDDIIELSRGRIVLAKEYTKDIKLMKLAKKTRDDFRMALKRGKLAQLDLIDGLVKDKTDLFWVTNEWVWYLKIFLEQSITNGQSRGMINKVYDILNKLLEVRALIKTTNVSKRVQLENFFVQI